jgi:hypothetical protein
MGKKEDPFWNTGKSGVRISTIGGHANTLARTLLGSSFEMFENIIIYIYNNKIVVCECLKCVRQSRCVWAELAMCKRCEGKTK